MKQRWWWHTAAPKDSISNFEEAQIIWTQWCKDKLCTLLTTNESIETDFSELIKKIDSHFTVKLTQNVDKQKLIVDKLQKFGVNISPSKTEHKQTEKLDLTKPITRKQTKQQNIKKPILEGKQLASAEASPDKDDKEVLVKTPVKSKRKKGKQQSMVIAEEDQQSNEFEQNTAANDLELQTKKSMDVALSPEPVVEKGPSTLQKMETLKKQF